MIWNKLKLNKIFLVAPLLSLMFCFNAPKDDDEKMQTIMVSVKNTLSYLHYSPKPIDDKYSKEVYDKYFEMVDPAKRYFLQSDMNEFATHKTKLDDYLQQGDLTFFKLTNGRILKRMDEIDKMTQKIFKEPIDFTEDEVLVLDSKTLKAPKNEAELYAQWKKYIKYNILQEIETLRNKEEDKKKTKDSLQKNGLKDTIQLKILSPEAKKVKATKEVKELISDSFRRYRLVKEIDWFSRYMNAYTEVFDPHTNYYSPQDKEDFDVNFSGTITGIGAIIQEKKGYLYLGPLTIGAPAWKSKQLTEGDKILKVKPMPGKDAVNVVGMLPSEAVRLIRGDEGTEVVLTIETKDKTVKDVKLIREQVEIEDTFARSIIIKTPEGKKYGFINLPGFNSNFNDPNGRNASDDIKNELIKLNRVGIEGVILDLRNNGGGSLTEVGDIMGLFMNEGPYVQVKQSNGKTQTLYNRQNEPLWTGPLVIMQNELSASASEILAGAMQDYGRAVVIGSPRSYGKGTVQTFVNLNRFLDTSDDYGALKLTIQKFYRITGKSTQKEGIHSDVVMKDYFSYTDVGERFVDYALPWDEIGSARFKNKSNLNLKSLEAKSATRMAKNKNYQLLLESAQWKKQLDDEEAIPLQEDKFFALTKERKEQIKKFKSLDKFKNGLDFQLYQEDIEREKTDEAFKVKSDNWMKNLRKDLYLQEAVNIVNDISS